MRVLNAIDDEYGGVVVDPESLPANPNAFAHVLHSSLSHWKMKVILRFCFDEKTQYMKYNLSAWKLIGTIFKHSFRNKAAFCPECIFGL